MRIVVKVGTSTLTYASGNLNIRRVEQLCEVLSDIKNSGHELIFVTSGAIAMGVGKLGLKERPEDMETKQAAAAVGQGELMYAYDRQFAEYNHTVAQILITAEDIQSEERRSNFSNTLERLLQLHVLPIINENDTVSYAVCAVGDNDTLAATVAISSRADLLVILTDTDGLYTADPRKEGGELVHTVTDVSAIEHMAGGAGTRRGTGGMATKIAAAKMCMAEGVEMVIMNGNDPQRLYDAISGESVGTRFVPGGNR